MSIILEDLRPRRRLSATAPKIREVCLVGVASRRYRHLPLEEGPRTGDSGLSPSRRSTTGTPKSGTG